jgi:hypothetical protein
MKLDGEDVTKVRFLSDNKVTFKHDSPVLRDGKAVLGMYETDGPVDLSTLETGFRELGEQVAKRTMKKPKKQPRSKRVDVAEAPMVPVAPVPVVEAPKVVEIPVGLDELAPKEEMVELAAPSGDKGEAKPPVPTVEVIVKPVVKEGETMVTKEQVEETKESVSKEFDIPVEEIDEEELKVLLEEEEELQAADKAVAEAVKPCSNCDEVAKEIKEQEIVELAAPKVEDTPVELPETPADEIITEEEIVEMAAPNPPTSIIPEEGAQSFASPTGDAVKSVEDAAVKAEKTLVEEPLKEIAEDAKSAEKTVEKTVGFGVEELKELADKTVKSDWAVWAMGLGLTVGPLLYAAYYQSKK